MHPTTTTRRSRRLLVLALAMLLIPVALTLPSAIAADGDAATATPCRKVSVPVTVDGATGPIAGTLCVPPGAKTLQILVHGVTYGQYYWDFPYQPEKYSYVRAANTAGYATLNIDRIGAGESWKPPSTLVNYGNHADSVHQVVQAVRQGHLGTFDKVVLVGHSYGSVITYIAAGRYKDVDAVVITGGSHNFNGVHFALKVGPSLIPTVLDPQLARNGLAPGYITTRPGTRSAFYNADNVDPKVLAIDDKLNQPATVTDAITTLPLIMQDPPVNVLLSATKNLNVPTFTINGAKEEFFCGGADCSSSQALANYEKQFYGPKATVEAEVVPTMGHMLNLEHGSTKVFTSITRFLNNHVGT